ncbi:MAG TPA: hypothetical protein H9875_03625 [Candidatus Levilactobacillus faecigallinarum]|uniref:Uncharacterized protein n=1 Tax=Candidatus Levilactobacillus faecigallinarum TaxID=2838638 RepID=A0A9D1U4I1_9LACO|nr:hypothetical protein [Candidatus Levilactobacillus faecigallinarum]
MSKKRMSQEEARRWRKIVFMDDDRAEKRPGKSPRTYVYGEGEQQRSSSLWQRMKRHFTR